MVTTVIEIEYIDGTKDDKRCATWGVDTARDNAQDFITKYVSNEKNPKVREFHVVVGKHVYEWTYRPTYPEHWGEPRIEVNYTYIAVTDMSKKEYTFEDAFRELEFDDRKTLTERMKAFGIDKYKVCVCACAWWTNNEGYCEYAYAGTKTEAKKKVMKLIK